MALTITWLTEKTCQATFSVTIPTREQLENTANFSIEAASGVSMTIYRSSPTAGVGTTILHVGPSVLPEQSYIIRFGDEVSVSEVPANIFPKESEEWSHKILDAMTEAFGEAIQRYSGRPQTLIVSNFKATDSALFVESTLGFPSKGQFFVGGIKYRYTSKDSMSFRGVSALVFQNKGLSPQEMVTCDVNSIFPD